MSEDESVEAGRHTGQAFKALLSAALVVADAHRQRQVREMRRMESEAWDRERDAGRRGAVDNALGRVATTTAPAGAGAPGVVAASVPVPVAVEDPVELAQRWAAAQQPDTDPVQRVELDKQVRASGVDPDQVRAEHAGASPESGPEATTVGRTADTVQSDTVQSDGVREGGVWQDGSPEVAKAGLSYIRRPGTMIAPGLSPQRRPRTGTRTAERTRGLGR